MSKEYDLGLLKDKELMAGIKGIDRIINIINQYSDEHLDPTMPYSPNKLAGEALILNSELIKLTKIMSKIGLYYSQHKTAKDKRYNDLYIESKKDKTTKRTEGEAKAIAESKVCEEGFYYHIDGLFFWKKRLELIYERTNEQINLYKKILGEGNRTYGN